MSENIFEMFVEDAAAEKRARLRDEFAMAALTGILANPSQYTQPDNVAREAYMMADAMLVQREKK